jgi:hypothetical protein
VTGCLYTGILFWLRICRPSSTYVETAVVDRSHETVDCAEHVTAQWVNLCLKRLEINPSHANANYAAASTFNFRYRFYRSLLSHHFCVFLRYFQMSPSQNPAPLSQ